MNSSENGSSAGATERPASGMPQNAGERASSSNGSDTPQPAAAPPPAPKSDRRRLEEALRGSSPAPGDSGDGGDGGEGVGSVSPSPPHSGPQGGETVSALGDGGETRSAAVGRNLEDLARDLDRDPSELYSTLIPIRDDQPVSLGDLKDAWQNRQAAEREIADTRARYDAEKLELADQRLMFAKLSESGRVPADMVEEFTADLQRQREKVSAMARKMFPDLNEPGAMEAERDAIAELMAPDGFRKSEIRVTDPREIRFLRRMRDVVKENAELKKQLRPAPPKTAKPQGTQERRSDTQQRMADARSIRSPRGKIAAVTGNQRK